ncbi:uncharacterized protein LOC108625770 isoform X2 [Ceratina calcarata]|uniref:Uncharacterized protein LOC108625770 isoform X2 n=1 Tax=Ceratina calcarata TaxID=156304 RepID=A0AAJ7J130_9HYME|nr:uncharacterized protein LOC108625770 isoform X2 [Ceratina calcarata]
MTSTLCTCTWLLLPCCVLVALSTGELDFYRDEIPESSESIALRELIRYLEGQRQRFPSLHKKYHADLEKQRDLFEALMDKGSLTELLRKPKEWEYRRIQYNDPPINELKPVRELYVPFYESKAPFDSPSEYSNLKLSNFPSDTDEDDTNFQDNDYGYNNRMPPLDRSTYEETNFDRGMKEETLQEFHRNYDGTVDQDGKDDRQMHKPSADLPNFTYRFDPPNLRERHPFAVKPNHPKYYEDNSFFLEDSEKLDTTKPSNDTKWEREDTATEKMHTAREGNSRLESKFKDASMIVIPEIGRRTENNPVFVPVNQDLNNDIYGFAVVAGCTAASVFLLVLIALTWYRIHRSTKDAADIEYPAYGVTGPNKEISPSGDQRLAQSAQMYHFQHQKQQIIAMENRVSASRDPGSVSEADSDEENEEGDYTVYECPGLASTGEMEVKNPLFHDDPTPATPAQINKEEDHNI